MVCPCIIKGQGDTGFTNDLIDNETPLPNKRRKKNTNHRTQQIQTQPLQTQPVQSPQQSQKTNNYTDLDINGKITIQLSNAAKRGTQKKLPINRNGRNSAIVDGVFHPELLLAW